MRSFLSILLVFFACVALQAQEDYATLVVNDTQEIAYYKDYQIIDARTDEVLYTVKGNLMFNGESEDRRDIMYLFKSNDVFSKKKTQVYAKDAQLELFACRKGQFYVGRSSMLSEVERLASFSQKDDVLLVFDFTETNVIAKIKNADIMDNAALLAAFIIFEAHFNWRTEAKERMKAAAAELEVDDSHGYVGTIKPRFGNPGQHEWVWDGRTLMRRWIKDIDMEWTFDGDIIKPLFNHDINYEYSWDGELFRPNWRNNKNEEYIIENNVIKPMWSSDISREFEIEGNLVTPRWASNPSVDWVITGDVPLPIIILVVYGYAYR